MAFITSASAVNSTNSGFVLTKANTASSSLFSKSGNQLNFNFCENQCRNEFSACMAQPDPYNINLDICRIKLDNCLVIRCGSGGINF